jgi:hypothetical protein
MELPDDVIHLIKEYSMPNTRPDWRTLHKMTYQLFKDECFNQAILRWNKGGENKIFTLWWYVNMYAATFY